MGTKSKKTRLSARLKSETGIFWFEIAELKRWRTVWATGNSSPDRRKIIAISWVRIMRTDCISEILITEAGVIARRTMIH